MKATWDAGRDASSGAGSGEDRELTAYLKRQIAVVLSPGHDPRPACPRCGGTHINSAGFRSKRTVGRLPLFECRSCGRNFNRAWGTPLGEKHLKKLDLFISLLSQPLPCEEAARLMGSLGSDLSLRVKAFRAWLLKLDPSGNWERRIRLGGRPTEVRPAPLALPESGAREDVVLTTRLAWEFDELYSASPVPPACPDCGSRETRLKERRRQGVPRFACLTCRATFTRRRGTPFVYIGPASTGRLRRLIRYLSLPLSFQQVADVFDTDPMTVKRWRDTFAQWADQLEPDGRLSSRFRLGVEPDAKTPCLFCGRTGTATRSPQATQDSHRLWSCAGCGRLFSMRRTVVEAAGVLQLVDDVTGALAAEPGAAMAPVTGPMQPSPG